MVANVFILLFIKLFTIFVCYGEAVFQIG